MKTTLLFCLLILSANLFAQIPIQFVNPSFEDTPRHSKVPDGWENCGFENESPPDIHPNGKFEVTQQPNHGNSYLGMVVRDNETCEAIGQRLRKPLDPDSTYAFGIHLAQSEFYVSMNRKANGEVNYDTPCILRVWGRKKHSNKSELLFITDPINHSDWKLYSIIFTPKSKCQYITFEIYYDTPTPHAYNGNLLLDNIVSDTSLLDLKLPTKEKVVTEVEEKEAPSELQKDLWSMEEMLEFLKYAKEEKVFNYFDYYPIQDIEILANSFRKFDMIKSADTIEDLIAEWKVAFQSADSNRKTIKAFKERCKNIDDVLIADKFDEKIDAFIEKNKEELKLLIDE